MIKKKKRRRFLTLDWGGFVSKLDIKHLKTLEKLGMYERLNYTIRHQEDYNGFKKWAKKTGEEIVASLRKRIQEA